MLVYRNNFVGNNFKYKHSFLLVLIAFAFKKHVRSFLFRDVRFIRYYFIRLGGLRFLFLIGLCLLLIKLVGEVFFASLVHVRVDFIISATSDLHESYLAFVSGPHRSEGVIQAVWVHEVGLGRGFLAFVMQYHHAPLGTSAHESFPKVCF
jgi:hypothetical protein